MGLKNSIAILLILVGAIGVPDLPKFEGPADDGGGPLTRQMTAEDRLLFRSVYSGMAKVVEADAGVMLSDLDRVRAWHVACLRSCWRGLGGQPHYDGLKSEVEKRFKAAIGDDRAEVTPEVREKLVKLFQDLSKE